MNASLPDILIGSVAGTLLVGSWAFVLWRRTVLLDRHRDRRAWADFLLALAVAFAAVAFAGQQLVSVVVDTDVAGRNAQMFLVGMGIGGLMVGGLLETSYLWRGRRD